jgi:hypothetical protein
VLDLAASVRTIFEIARLDQIFRYLSRTTSRAGATREGGRGKSRGDCPAKTKKLSKVGLPLEPWYFSGGFCPSAQK